MNSDGERTDADSETVAVEIPEDSETAELLTSMRYDASGIGYYVAFHERADGSVVSGVYLTIDFAENYDHPELHRSGPNERAGPVVARPTRR